MSFDSWRTNRTVWSRKFFVPLVLAAACDIGTASVPPLAEWSVSTEPVVVIGIDGRTGHELYRVLGAIRLTNGRIAITNSGSSQIRFYSPDGTYLGSAGGEGGGPEELRRIQSTARADGDTILVFTWEATLSAVSPSGRVVSKVRVDISPMQVPCRGVELGLTVIPTGAFLMQAEDTGNPGCPATPEGLHQRTALLALYDSAVGRLDTLAVLPGTERDGPRYAAFGRTLAVAISPNRIFAGETGGDSIAVFSVDGEQLATWRHPLEAVPLTEAARAYKPQPFRARDGRVVTPEPFTAMPQAYPRFARLLADRADNLWVMAYPVVDEPMGSWRMKSLPFPFVEQAGARWIVLDSTGHPAARVRTPPGLYPLEIGFDYVLGMALDELDVETVRLYRLLKGRE
jgi:hypothetical protein